METVEKVALIKETLEDKKGIDVVTLSLSNISSIADGFVISSGTSEPHVKALSDEVYEKMGKAGYSPLRVEGYNSAKWILMDYGDVIVHVFTKEAREFYNLEWLWADGKEEFRD